MTKNPVVHFEMPYEDANRVADFYSTAFGWQMNILDEKMGNYILATTTDTDDNQMVKTPGTINGGFFEKKSSKYSKVPSVVIGVDNLEEAMIKVKQAGGEILGEPVKIQGVGTYVSFRDSENNIASMMQSEK